MGALYLVKDQDAFGRVRVLKELLDYVDPADYPDRTAYEGAVQRAHERFEDEARILAQLHHRGIPEIIAYFSELGRNYIVMEYVEGKDLNVGLTHVNEDGQLVQGQPYPVEDVVRWGIQVCKILEYLGTRKPTPVIHHDIKPANLILDKNTGDIRLVDFGTAQVRLAAQLDAKSALKKASVFGTIGYAPPEQYQGKSVPKSDVYALAATMYHLLTDDDPQQHPMSFPWPKSLERPLLRALSRAVEPDLRRRSTAAQLRRSLEQWLAKPQTQRPARRKGDFRVVLRYVPDQSLERSIDAIQQALSLTETEATLKALSAPISLLNTTSFPRAEKVAARLQAAGADAQLVEVDESYSRALGQGSLRQQLVSRGQSSRIMVTKLARDRHCHCYQCGHDWIAPISRRRRPPDECPRCRSRRWSVRRVFKCRVCGHEFPHGDPEPPARQLFPACPACGTIDWLPSRAPPVLGLKSQKLNLGTVRLDETASVTVSVVNRGKGALRGIVRCREPWLQAERIFAGEGEISLPVDTGLLTGERRYQGLIEVLSTGGAQQVRVEFFAQTPEQLTVSPAILDFGQVDGRPPTHTLRVANSGGGMLHGSATADAPWLELSSSEISGNLVDLDVVAQPPKMPAGQSVSASIRLATNGGQVDIPVRAATAPPKLELSPRSLDFGPLSPRSKQRRMVQVTNSGTGQLRGRVLSRPNWLRLSRARWSGNAVELTVEVDGRRLADGVERTGAIRLSSNGGDADLPVRAVALGPTLIVEPNAVNLGQVPAGSKTAFRIQLANNGSGELAGTVRSTEPWLHLDTERFSGRREVKARLRTRDLAPGRYAGAIEIESNGGNTSVVVHTEVTDPAGWFERVGGLLPR
jgi:serine/threonine protein kinase